MKPDPFDPLVVSLTALVVLLAVLFWWPLVLVSWHYWMG